MLKTDQEPALVDLVKQCMSTVESRIKARLACVHPLTAWLVKHYADVQNRSNISADGRTPCRRLNCRKFVASFAGCFSSIDSLSLFSNYAASILLIRSSARSARSRKSGLASIKSSIRSRHVAECNTASIPLSPRVVARHFVHLAVGSNLSMMFFVILARRGLQDPGSCSWACTSGSTVPSSREEY